MSPEAMRVAFLENKRVRNTVERRIEHLANFATEIFVTISRAIEQIHDGFNGFQKFYQHIEKTFGGIQRKKGEKRNFALFIGKF